MNGRRFLTALCWAAVGLEIWGCAEPEPEPLPAPQRATYLGAIEDSDVRIAVLRDGDAFLAYVCGAGETLASHTRWFSGELVVHDAGAPELMSDGWRLAILEAETHLRGELVSPDGTVARFRAPRIADDARTTLGVYESRELGCRAGVIVWDSAPCRAQGAFCDDAGRIGQITPAACPSGETWRVEAHRDDVTLELTVQRVPGPR